VWDTSVTLCYCGIFNVARVAGADAGTGAITVGTTPITNWNTHVSSAVVRIYGVAGIAGADTRSSALSIEAPIFTNRNTRCITVVRGLTVSHVTCTNVG
jgi:hypothetical protein